MYLNVRETLKPKVLGYSRKRRSRSVDLPPPEGPDTTIVLLSAVGVVNWIQLVYVSKT